MDDLKKIFQLKPSFLNKSKPETKNSEAISINENDIRIRTYHTAGFEDCQNNNASAIALENSFDRIFAQFQNEERTNQLKQDELRRPYINEQKLKESEIKGFEVALENKNDEIKLLQNRINQTHQEIENKKFEINDLSQFPEKYGIDAKKGASTKFWLGVILLIPITLYLITFYISTSYSAFFKKFTATNGIIDSVLDPLALTKSWNDGIIEGSFVTLIPFVFMGLGYLIHMFGEKKTIINYVKIGLLIIVTFLFDAILAYSIDNKIYDINKTLMSEEFGLSKAFTSIEFWGIIFAGFIVYLIWGLVLDFVMKEHGERDKIKLAQKQRWRDIEVLKERNEKFQKEIDTIQKAIISIKDFIAKAKGRINELQSIIDGVIIATKEYKLYSTEYFQGWLEYLNGKIVLSATEKRKCEEDCKKVHIDHLEKVGVSDNSLNTIFVTAS